MITGILSRSAMFAVLALTFAACSGDDTDASPGTGADTDHAYVVGSLVFGPEGTTSAITVLSDLGVQTIDNAAARTFNDQADVWVYEGSVYVIEGETKVITKYSVANGQLVAQGQLSLVNYGPTDVGFWRNTFVTTTKAYFLSNTDQYIVWNPTTMEITGTIDLPTFTPMAGYMVYPAYADRGAIVRDGKLYQPFYYTDTTYFKMGQGSQILVLDTTTDKLAATLDAPCPGLDYATADDAGNLYFSSWIYAAGGALVLHQPDTCVVKLAAGSDTPSVAFTFSALTQGRQGAALRYIGHGKAMMSVLHGEHATIDDTTDAGTVTYADNWRFWIYDFAANTATELDSFDWNDGGQYSFAIDSKNYVLVSKSDYSATSIYDLNDTTAPIHLFDTTGWSTRLFQVN